MVKILDQYQPMYFQNDTFTSVPETLVPKSVILRCQMAFRQTNELEIDLKVLSNI